nr:hypothetical protein [Saprospiraceae bacterium]
MTLPRILFFAVLALLFTACEKDDDNGGDDPTLDPIILSGSETAPRTLESIFNNPATADYIVDGTWSINAAVTVEPGIRFLMTPGARIDIGSSGSLTAEGTSDQPIYIEGEAEARGYWDYIRFQSNNPNNILDYCIISHGGGSSFSNREASVSLVGNAQLSMTNTTIRESQRNGFIVTSSDNRLPLFQNNTVTGCEQYPIGIRPNQLSAIDETTDFTTGNGFNKIAMDGTSIDVPLTINKVAGPYLFVGTTSFNSNTEISPGTYIEMGPGARIQVGSSGSLSMIGTSSDRITITGEQPAKGYWDYIYYNGTNSPENQIKYTDISYGGGSTFSGRDAIIGTNSSAFFSMENSSITNSMRYGITLRSNSVFEDLGGNVFEGNEEGDIND